MSEYQHYEFQAVDRPLTQEQMAELRACSTRAEITPTRFVNSYNWGSFKGNTEKWMETYFDAHLYRANWGTRVVILRIPARLLDEELLDRYCTEESLNFCCPADYTILFFSYNNEEYSYDEGEDSLSPILPVRSSLMRGDLRALYLGWLMGVQNREVDDDEEEPPLPPGLGQLDASHKSFADFFLIDRDLIAAAAEGAADEQMTSLSRREIDLWVSGLPVPEKDLMLAALIEGSDPNLGPELLQRAAKETRTASRKESGPRRTAGEILARAEAIAEARKREESERNAREKALRERAEAERRMKYLQSLVGRENDLWAKIERLIAAKQPGPYGEAVMLLQDLRDLSDMTAKTVDFNTRMHALCNEHSRKPALLERFRKAKLI